MAKSKTLMAVKVKQDLDDVPPEELTPRLFNLGFDFKDDRNRRVAIAYRNPESPTCGNLLGSVKAEGFPEAWSQRKCESLTNSKRWQEFVRVLTDFFAKLAGFDDDSLKVDVAELQSRARAKNDLSMLAKCIELKARYLGCYTESKFVPENSEENTRLAARTEEEAAKLRRLADLSLKDVG